MHEAWVHNISPFLVEFSHGVGVRWYGLAYLAGFVLTYFLVDWLAKRGGTPLKREQAADLITYLAVGTLAGGRVGYVLFYSPELLTTFHADFPFWGLLDVHRGGMASHGGIMGVIVACWLFARKHKVMTTHLMDIACVGGTVGFFFGRLANFINGELYGRECRPDLWMAVKFPSEIYQWGLTEADKLKALAPAVVAVGEVSAGGEKVSATTDLWVDWVNNLGSHTRAYIDLFKEALVKATENHNAAVIDALAPVLTPRYPSQLIQAALEGLLVLIILIWVWRKARKPGVISAIFGICYAINRIVGEQFRLPDHDIGYQALGLTRGQWLSITMLVLSAAYLYYVARRPVATMGGWGKKELP